MFSSFLLSVIAFLVALGILISIHEFGHFWVARKMDVKVLKFSIGFGRSLWSRRGKVDNTEFALAAIPLGGYVRMLDEREGNVQPNEVHRAFNRKSVWARIAIVLAGPLANFLLAILVYWIVMMTGISGIAPLIGDIDENTPAAAAGFEFEDKIRSVNGVITPTWTDARINLLQHALESRSDPVAIEVETLGGDFVVRTMQVDNSIMLDTEVDPVKAMGINQWWPKVPAVIGGIQEGGAAAAAGLVVGDEVVSVDQQDVENWQHWVEIIRANPAQELDIELIRAGERVQVLLTPGEKVTGDMTIGFIGAWETESVELAQKARIVVSYPPLEAFVKGLQRTWDMSILTLRMIAKLITGQASLDNISGPISIAKYAGQSVSVGMDHYLNFIAIISISLAVLNLLPIPMLDGGHLLYYAIEVITGRPLSERVQIIGQQFGLVILGGLMLLAFYNDFWRFAG